ncbi:MAG: TAXI family TRAP transporter solute-binding subunit [Vicinamibacterales bacterium]
MTQPSRAKWTYGWSLIVLAVVTTASSACSRSTPPTPPPSEVSIATGGTGGVYYPLGVALAQSYNKRLPNLHATAYTTVASVFNVDALEAKKAELAFVQGDIAYFAYKRGTASSPTPHRSLRAIAILFQNVVQIVVRQDSHIRHVTDFRGHNIGVGSLGSGTEEVARIIVESHGLKYTDLQPGFLSFGEIAQAMEARTLEGGFIVASYPVSAILAVTRSLGVRLVPIEPTVINAVRGHYPFLKPILIPKGTYQNQTEDVTTVAIDNLLVCRDDLPEQLVHDLTKTLFESLPDLAATHPAASIIDPDIAAMTAIPLHPGAARYYRERELLQ